MSESLLFQHGQIGTLKVPNRFIRSATWEGLAAPDGSCTDELVRLMETLAEGGVGLIISSHAFILPEGYAVRGQIGVHRDDLIAGLARMSDAVHRKGGRIALQLAHGGLLADTQLTGRPPFAPSLAGGPEKIARREMTEQDIGNTTRRMARPPSGPRKQDLMPSRSMPLMAIFSTSFSLLSSTGEQTVTAAASKTGSGWFLRFSLP